MSDRSEIATGGARWRLEARSGDQLAPAAFPETTVAVDDVLPPG